MQDVYWVQARVREEEGARERVRPSRTWEGMLRVSIGRNDG